MSLFFTYLSSPIGPLLLAADKTGLHEITFSKNGAPASPQPDWIEDESVFAEHIRQLLAYFAGDLETFDLPLVPQGTPFQQKVWNELLNIPYGETISYGQLATRIGNSNASRAVGLANGSNPIPIIIPCHRVIGANGTLTGYGGGLERKKWLLEHEAAAMRTELAVAAR